MTTKKKILIILFSFSTFVGYAQNTQLILRFREGFHPTKNYFNTVFAPNSVEIEGESLCFNTYLLKFSNPNLAFLNNCDSLEALIQGVKPNTGSDIQSGSWNTPTDNNVVTSNSSTTYNPDSLWLAQWGDFINKPETTSMCPIKIAFLDTGMDPTHLSTNPWFIGRTSALNIPKFGATWQDGHGHGTHVAGITAQLLQNYTNFNYITIKTQDNAGKSTIWDIIKGVEVAVQQGAKIVNMSLVYFSACPITNFSKDPLKSALAYAGVKYNMVFVTAAGNQGCLLPPNGSPGCTFTAVYPSMFNLANQVNVANNNNLGVLHPTSNYGHVYVDFSTTGVNISSSDLAGTYSKQTGTSMAAPHATAIAAVIAALNCGGNPMQPSCGTQAPNNPHHLLITNSLLNGSSGATSTLGAGVIQPYFAKKSMKYSKICNCN